MSLLSRFTERIRSSIKRLQDLPGSTRSLLFACIYGLSAALLAVAFQKGLTWIFNITIVAFSKGTLWHFLGWSLLSIVVSAAIGGFLLTKFCPQAAGSGIPQLKFAFWQDFGYVPFKAVWVKFVAGLLHVGGGLSMGREGPSVHFAGGLASQIALLLGIPKQRLRRPAIAGAAAGLAAAFNTPIASVTFVLEEIIQDMNSPVIGTTLLAAVIGAFTVHALIGPNPAFILPSVETITWPIYIFVPFVAAASAFIGFGFQRASMSLRTFSSAQRGHPFFKKWPIFLNPAIAAVVTWMLGVSVFLIFGHLGVFSLGYGDLTLALHANLAWKVALAILIAKWLATSACYGFGGCGGIFSPTLCFGGLAGAVLAAGFGHLCPLTKDDHVLLSIVGMSACLCAVVRAPFTSILIVFEMTRQFEIVPALMLAVLTSEAISRRFSPRNFYEEVLHQDGQMLRKVMPPRDLRSWQNYPVASIANFTPACFDCEASERSSLLADYRFSEFPVVKDGRYVGIATRAAIQAALAKGEVPETLAAPSCMRDDTIQEAGHAMIQSATSIIAIIDQENGKPVGVLTLHDLLRAQQNFAAQGEY